MKKKMTLSKLVNCRYIPILLLMTISLLLYFLCSYFWGITCFGAALAQIAGAVGARGLEKVLIRVGFPSSLAFFLASALRAFFTTGVIEGNMMAPPNDQMVPSGSGGPSHSPSWKESSFEIDVLLEEWPTTAGGESAETGTSVNRPESGRVPPATHVAPRGDEAGPSNQPPQGVPYPYHPEQVIGGDSVLSIERRLLSGQTTPSPLDIYLARIDAEDLFEAKVKILQRMAELDPTGDWERRGARALDNPRTATGEESLERLLSLFSDLDQRGRGSEAFIKLRGKVFRRETPPSEGSGT